MSTIFIIDLKNNQQDYANTFLFFEYMESRENDKLKNIDLIDILNKISIYIGEVNNTASPVYFEKPLMDPRTGKNYNVITNKRKFDYKELKYVKEKRRYHIRIHFEGNINSINNNFANLQFLHILLKKFSDFLGIDIISDSIENSNKNIIAQKNNELKKHISVFLVPISGSSFPFSDKNGQFDTSIYDMASSYFLFFTNIYNGVIFGADGEKYVEPDIKSLDTNHMKKIKDRLPLLIINQKIYEEILNCKISNDSWNEVENLRKSEHIDKNGKIILSAGYWSKRLLEICYYRIREFIDINLSRELIIKLKLYDLSLMNFIIFSFLISSKTFYNEINDQKLDLLIDYSKTIANGLLQIIQNSIFYTDLKCCFLSICLHQKNENQSRQEYIASIQKLYPDTEWKNYFDDSALQILVSDFNEKNDVLSTFQSNIEEDYKYLEEGNYDGYENLLKNYEKIKIENFFGEFKDDEIKEIWSQFRKEDIAAHIGLGIFALNCKKCETSFLMTSSREICIHKEDNYKSYYCAYSNKNANTMPYNGEKEYVLPGTHYSLLIPIQLWELSNTAGMGQLEHNNLNETYSCYADFLDYTPQIIDGSEYTFCDKISFNDYTSKFKAIIIWRDYWHSVLESLINNNNDGMNKIYYLDFSNDNFNNNQKLESNLEVLIKGFISAISVLDQYNEKLYLAFTSLPDDFVRTFVNISILYSIKNFPENLQIYFVEKNVNKRLLFLGSDFEKALYNSYVLSLEQGVDVVSQQDVICADQIKNNLLNLKNISNVQKSESFKICPFDVIITDSNKEQTIFESYIAKMIEGALDENTQGYKINNTHMKLGNKVHIESFYEMSFLFYRTNISNRVAFCILKAILKKRMNNMSDIDLINDKISFYGYSSYSRAILYSLNEILKAYRYNHNANKKQHDIEEYSNAIISYQHNLLLETEEIQLYYDIPAFMLSNNEDNNNEDKKIIYFKEATKVIQIVPIASTLSTYSKMWEKLYNSVGDTSKLLMEENYTFFWVVDENGDLDQGLPSDMEEPFWKKITDHNIIDSNLYYADNKTMKINFFLRSSVKWHNPLGCDLCYPQCVINEVPLVETDHTSTVPGQQIRYRYDNYENKIEISHKTNNDRFIKLQGCVYYDHIARRENHYQFYIDTQKYFKTVKDMVKGWLSNIDKEEVIEPVLNIIFSPEHNTNVGFVQYVNTYYFGGMAEVITINVDKQFRSNFICEHSSLKEMIKKMHENYNGLGTKPVKFYFVDDSIITGDTLKKANNLLHSIVPDNTYDVNIFSKIFVLVDRLSKDTKRMYIENPEENFLMFLHIDVSNIRTLGDSCVGCKLEHNAQKLYTKSATGIMSNYWLKKQEIYETKAYDSKHIKLIDLEKSYKYLAFTHVVQNILVKNSMCYSKGDAFDIVLYLSLWLLDSKETKGLMNNGLFNKEVIKDSISLLNDNRNIKGELALLKIICRPFFTYDFKIKSQIFTFMILLTEMFLDSNKFEDLEQYKNKCSLLLSDNVSYVLNNNRLENLYSLKKLIDQNINNTESEIDIIEFIQCYLFEGLTDLDSTYLMRLNTLKKTYTFINKHRSNDNFIKEKDFWVDYEAFLHRLVNGNGEELRELWLEYMYITGLEYEDYSRLNKEDYSPMPLYKTITGQDKPMKDDIYFYQFCDDIFMQNTSIYFKYFENRHENKDKMIMNESIIRRYWKQKAILNNKMFKKNVIDYGALQTEENLFELLQYNTDKESDQGVSQWYDNFLKAIEDMIRDKYSQMEKDINTALITKTQNDEKEEFDMQSLDIVKERLNNTKNVISETRYAIKNRIKSAANDKQRYIMDECGYYIGYLDNEIRSFIIIDFKNHAKKVNINNSALTNMYKAGKLDNVYIYISVSNHFADKTKMLFELKCILRDILTYRNRILYFLEKDFAGEIYASYAHTIGEKNILSHEKANSHNTTADDYASMKFFLKSGSFDKTSIGYKYLDKEAILEWLLLRNYVNSQIAKIFNKSFQDHSIEKSYDSMPLLYIPADYDNENNSLFKQKLLNIMQLDLKGNRGQYQDLRIKKVKDIIEIEYADGMENAQFIQGADGNYYNLEYFKCILIDIMFSALKACIIQPEFLLRINRAYEVKELIKKSLEWPHENEEIKKVIENLNKEKCIITIQREKTENEDIDFLVLKNRVEYRAKGLKNWEQKNDLIIHRLKDPLDYADGHMSMFVIKRYIENINPDNRVSCVFKYEYSDDIDDLFFVTKLPVLRRNRNE